MPRRNQRFLREFRTWLAGKGLSEKTIRSHLDNAELYLDHFLDDEELEMEDGTEWLDEFFDEFYIRDCAWSTPASLKSTAVSIRKFYQCMTELGHIDPEDYDGACETIRLRLPEWQRDCAAYNDSLFAYDEDEDEDEDEDGDDLFFADEQDDPAMYGIAVTDRMYELAFAFKKAKLWKQLREDEIFAVRLDGDRVGYVSILGRGGDYFALSLYPGDEAFATLRLLLDAGPAAAMSARSAELLMQDCVQLSLDNRDKLDEDTAEAVRAYARENGIVLRGAHAFPNFGRYYPHRVPWSITSEQDARDITRALEAALALPQLMRDSGRRPARITSLPGEPAELLLAEPDGKGFRLGSASLPARRDRVWPEPSGFNDIAIARLRRMRRSEPLACEIVRLPTPVRAEDGLPPYFPAALIGVDAEDGMILQLGDADGAVYDPDEMLESVTENLLDEELYPRAILVRTPETEAILRGFCERAGIELRIEEELPELDEALYEIRSRLSDGGWDDWDGPDESLEDMVEQLETLDALGADMPPGIRMAIRQLVQSGEIPKPLADRLMRLLD